MQERLYPVMDRKEALLERCRILIRGLQILDIPLLCTEQYPRGLGPTLDELTSLLPVGQAIEKIHFSCWDEAAFRTRLEQSQKKTVILCGIEAHVCVLQTVTDLIAADYTVVVVTDCISSRKPADMQVALQRMQAEGAWLSTSESILFELTRRAGTEEFKSISNLVK